MVGSTTQTRGTNHLIEQPQQTPAMSRGLLLWAKGLHSQIDPGIHKMAVCGTREFHLNRLVEDEPNHLRFCPHSITANVQDPLSEGV